MTISKRIALVALSAIASVVALQPARAQLEPQAGNASSITLGIYQPPTIEYGNEINAVNTLTGKKHGIVQIYINFSYDFDGFLNDQINRQMAAEDRPVMLIAWQPTDGRKALGCNRDYSGGIPPSDITAGACDAYIVRMAQRLKARSERFLLKFAHEMNNTDVPWAPARFGQSPSAFIAEWRHVKSIFATQGVRNVEWIWAPIFQSYPNTPENNPNVYYPGNEYVDWIGVSGYNYNLAVYSGWLSFSQIFDGVLRDFTCRYPKPQIIHEMASAEGSGGGQTKAAWIADAYAQMPKYPRLRAVVWYNELDYSNPAIDFRVTGSTTRGGVGALPSGSGAWTNAYRAAVANGVFVKSLPSLAQATPLAASPQGIVGINANIVPRVRLPIISTGGSTTPGGC